MPTRPEVRYATIFIFPACGPSERPIVSTTPERLTVRSGEIIDWTIVDATGRVKPGRVTIGWKGRSPVEGDLAFTKTRFTRVVVAKVPNGRYKYNVAIDGNVVFDPEVEVMN